MAPIDQLAAQQFATQPPPAEVIEFLQPLIEAIKPVIGIASAIVGGLFGLYLIFIISRLYYERKKVKVLKDIRYDLDYLNQHFNLPYSQEKKPLKLRKIVSLEKLKELEEKQGEKKEKKKWKRRKRKEKGEK